MFVLSLSKKQEMVGLLTPNVVVIDLSSLLSSMLLCERKRRRRRGSGRGRGAGGGKRKRKK